MTLTAARIALLCALVGLAASSAAAYVHYHMLTDPTYTSACDISETVSCTKVYSSQFGSWRGIPVAAAYTFESPRVFTRASRSSASGCSHPPWRTSSST